MLDNDMDNIPLMWLKLKQYHELPMTGNGHHTTYENGDNWGMVCYCFTNVNHKSSTQLFIYDNHWYCYSLEWGNSWEYRGIIMGL